MIKEAKRLQFVGEYYFSIKLAELETLRLQGKSILNLGIGSPDLPPASEVLNQMTNAIMQKDLHGYQSYRGHLGFRKSIASFYQKYFDVKLNPRKEILPLIGSKEGIMHISMAFINPGDLVLIPNPGYMTYRSASLLAGGIPVEYHLKSENNWLPDFKEIEKLDLNRVKIMWINYPHMPTGAVADANFFQELIQFSKKHNILIVNDNPYGLILNETPLSILKFDSDFENVMELNSLSKSHNMAGWRIGMLSGNSLYIDAVMKFKSNMDSGIFGATQIAASQALDLQDNWLKNLNSIYKERKKMAMKIYQALEIQYSENQSGLFLWGKLPQEIESGEFVNELLKKTGIFLAPGYIFGSNGKNYVRISLTNNTKILKEALHRIERQII